MPTRSLLRRTSRALFGLVALALALSWTLSWSGIGCERRPLEAEARSDALPEPSGASAQVLVPPPAGPTDSREAWPEAPRSHLHR